MKVGALLGTGVATVGDAGDGSGRFGVLASFTTDSTFFATWDKGTLVSSDEATKQRKNHLSHVKARQN